MRHLWLALLLGCGANPPPPAAPASAPAALVAPVPEPAPAAPALRLPGGVKPTRYAVELTLRPTDATFEGAIDVDLELDAPTRVIWLEAHDLAIHSATLQAAGAPVAVDSFHSDDFLGFRAARPVGPGTARLHVSYQGLLPDGAATGLFRVKDGGRPFVFSKFESIFARRAFPCFDEPGYKVPWQLTLHIPADQAAFSNTPVVGEAAEAGGLKRVRFAPTAPLPSYLVALAVGPLERVDAGVAGRRRTPVGIIVPAGRAREAAYAAAIAAPLLERLEAYFDIPYPYDKLDVVALPEQPGAMENAGLITVAARWMLGDETRLPLYQRRTLVHIVAHEMAHMWFGDLVTMAWWDDIWLNEGFATWMDLKIVAAWQPSWKSDNAAADERGQALGADALASARRIRQPIETSDDILSSFDSITYQKGGAVLAMVEAWLGPEVFRQGVRAYLLAHTHGSATSADFLAALGAAAGRDVAPVVSSFTDQPGVPLVRATLVCDRGAAPRVRLSQEPLRSVGQDAEAADQRRWHIPICVRYPDGKRTARTCTVLADSAVELPLEAKACPSTLVANDGELGYYVVRYPADALARLFAHGVDLGADGARLRLLADVIALVERGQLPAEDALALGRVVAADGDAPLLARYASFLVDLDMWTVADADRPRWRRFVAATLGARARALGWLPGVREDDEARLLRGVLVPAAVVVGGDETLRRDADQRARRWLDDRTALDPDLRAGALWVAGQDGDAALFERVHAQAARETDPDTRILLLRALVRFHRPELLQRGLALLLSPEVTPREQVVVFYQAGAHDAAAQPVLRAFVRQNLDALVARYPPNYASDILHHPGACDAASRAELADFFDAAAARVPGGLRAARQKLEEVDLCIAARAVQGPSVGRFLQRSR